MDKSTELKRVESTRIKNNIQNNNLANSVADNMGNIINLASDIVEIQKMKVQSDAILEKMKEDRKALMAEAEAYVMKKRVDTSSVIEQMRVIQDMMREFYQYNNSNMSGEDFSKIISDIITQMRSLD